VLANLFVIDNDLEATYTVWSDGENGLFRHGYFTY